jgi:hypothetical protein
MVLQGAPDATGDIDTRGSTGEDPHPARQSLASWHDAPVHLLGLRMFLDSGVPGNRHSYRRGGLGFMREQPERIRESVIHEVVPVLPD